MNYQSILAPAGYKSGVIFTLNASTGVNQEFNSYTEQTYMGSFEEIFIHILISLLLLLLYLYTLSSIDTYSSRNYSLTSDTAGFKTHQKWPKKSLSLFSLNKRMYVGNCV